MKGLVHIPSVKELQEVYRELQNSTLPSSAENLALWAQWSRFDPRLGEQWIQHIGQNWELILPSFFNKALSLQPWPFAAGPLLEQVPLLPGFNKMNRLAFNAWCKCVMADAPKANGELFFIGTRAFAGEAVRKDAFQSLKLYSKWGLYSRDLLINKASVHKYPTLLSSHTRKVVLEELLSQKEPFQVKDYIRAAGGAITVRQAEIDLANRKDVNKRGNTRGRYYYPRVVVN